MKPESVIGQTLDDKYKIERQLGKGGMGTVYLATHIGTERPVAVKVIASEFMKRAEFVERFRREARAAGRLRHPNVVNVTDFGFSATKDGDSAYLVMEYLDGCTLGEILKEEKNLPLSWTIDILEQVCSAVQEAHEQGIIHRDLKPDNIWLEPNQRGGYTVKVLDFGIAKLEEASAIIVDDAEIKAILDTEIKPLRGSARETIAGNNQIQTFADRNNSTAVSESATMALNPDRRKFDSEAGTLIQSGEAEKEEGTKIFPANQTQVSDNDDNTATKILTEFEENATQILTESDENATQILSEETATNKSGSKNLSTAKSLIHTPSTAELTRVGAVLGTPLYMSPEQCRGEKLTPGSDVYSLGVIAYQMLSGKTPFDGDYTQVMEAHKEQEPPRLEAKKVPRKVKKTIHAALSKDPSQRHPSAQAFASELRAQSEGIGVLLQRSLEIYSKYLPKFLGLSILLYLPFISITLLKLGYDILTITEIINSPITSTILSGIILLITTFFGIFCGYLVFGTTTWIVSQVLAYPLRPVTLRQALKRTRTKWKKLLGTGLLVTILTTIGYALCIFPGMVLSVIWALTAPVVMMENLRGRAALKRSKKLVMRSLRTTVAAAFLMFFVPFLIAGTTSAIVALLINSISPKIEQKEKSDSSIAEAKKSNEGQSESDKQTTGETQIDDEPDINISLGNKNEIKINGADKSENKMASRIKALIREDLTNILMLPFQIILASLSSIIVALLYLKTRQIGGESTEDLYEQFEEDDQPSRNWQKRMNERVVQSGRTTTGKRIITGGKSKELNK